MKSTQITARQHKAFDKKLCRKLTGQNLHYFFKYLIKKSCEILEVFLLTVVDIEKGQRGTNN